MVISNDIQLERQSNFELLRLFSMFSIILYHLILFFVEPKSDLMFWKAIQIPLHTGVIAFLLISGYFGIKFSLKGLFALLTTVLVIWFPFEFIRYIVEYDSSSDIHFSDILNSLFCITKGPYWFILQYIILYILSPLINNAIYSSRHLHIYSVVVLGFITFYGGFVSPEIQMINGKNIFMFSFVYVLGRYIGMYKPSIQWKWGGIFILVNFLLVVVYVLFGGGVVGKIIFKLFFNYSSPGLLFNSLLLFFFFEKKTIVSNFINEFAKSTFSMYIVHHHPLVLSIVIPPIIGLFVDCNTLILMAALIVITLLLMAFSFIVFKFVQPLIIKTQSLGVYLSNRINISSSEL